MFESKEIDTINNTDNYDTYTDISLSEKEYEEKRFQGTQSVNGLKGQVRAKKTDSAATTITTQDNAIEKTLDREFAVPLDFNFFGILSNLMD